MMLRTVHRHSCLSLALLSLLASIAPSSAWAETEEDVLQALQEAKQELTDSKYLLRYRYAAGETIRYDTEQLCTIDTTIAGNNQQTQLRTQSTRRLQVISVSPEGNMQFDHAVERVNMWSEVEGRESVTFDSEKDKEPPPGYESMAQHLGTPISVITLSPQGTIVEREDKVQQPDLGFGGISIRLPEEEVPVGYTWSQPLDIKVRLEDQRVKTIKTRELYCLEKVETGVATISIKTQVLTPIDDPRIKAQIIQRISQGELRFDIDAGRLISKQLDWDESVLGFSGPQSNMKYLARFTEKLAEERTANRE